MGKINIGSLGQSKKHRNEKRSFDNEINFNRVEYKLIKLSKIESLLEESKVCYIYGMGAHSKSTYDLLAKLSGVELKWKTSLLPFWLRPLSIVIASYAGLIKIVSITAMTEVFMKLAESSMVGLYIFDSKHELDFINATKKSKLSVDGDFLIKSDPSYLIYQVDADNYESSTGVYEIVSYGIKCPEEFEAIVNSR
jgi:hypothetical protein